MASLDRWIRIRRLETVNMCGDQNACAPLTSVADGTGDVRGSARRKLIMLLARDALLIECLVFMISFTLPAAGTEWCAPARALPRIEASPNGRFLITENGMPFFWLGDTGWWMTGISPAEVDVYLAKRAAQQFNVIQFHCGRMVKDYAGRLPFRDNDPLAPDEEYCATSIPSYRRRRLTASTLHSCRCGARSTDASSAPMPNDQANSASGSVRYASRTNVLWIASGEYDSINGFRIPITATQKAVLTAAARGIHGATGGRQLITVHPGVARLRLPTSTTSPG